MTINRHGGAVEVIKKESMIGAKHIVSVKSEERLYALIFDDEASPHGVIFLCYFVFNLIVTCMTLTKPTSLKLTYKTHLRRGLHFNLLRSVLHSPSVTHSTRQRFFPTYIILDGA